MHFDLSKTEKFLTSLYKALERSYPLSVFAEIYVRSL